MSDVRQEFGETIKCFLRSCCRCFYLVTWAEGSNLFENSVSGGCNNGKPRVSRVY